MAWLQVVLDDDKVDEFLAGCSEQFEAILDAVGSCLKACMRTSGGSHHHPWYTSNALCDLTSHKLISSYAGGQGRWGRH